MWEKTSVTAEVIYTALNEKMYQLLNTSEPWHNYTSAAVSNTSANIGIQLKQESLPVMILYISVAVHIT